MATIIFRKPPAVLEDTHGGFFMFMKQLILDYWKKGVLILVTFIVIISTFFIKQNQTDTFKNVPTAQIRKVDVTLSGDVNQPGKYSVPAQLSVDEIIHQYAKGMKQVENPQIEVQVSNPEKKPFQPVKINFVSVEELQNVPNIGPTKAQKLIAFRTEHGPFKGKDDLRKVKGFGDATVTKLLPYIDFSLTE